MNGSTKKHEGGLNEVVIVSFISFFYGLYIKPYLFASLLLWALPFYVKKFMSTDTVLWVRRKISTPKVQNEFKAFLNVLWLCSYIISGLVIEKIYDEYLPTISAKNNVTFDLSETDRIDINSKIQICNILPLCHLIVISLSGFYMTGMGIARDKFVAIAMLFFAVVGSIINLVMVNLIDANLLQMYAFHTLSNIIALTRLLMKNEVKTSTIEV